MSWEKPEIRYTELTRGAKEAIGRGVGKYKRYAVDKTPQGEWYIAVIAEEGRAGRWIKVNNVPNKIRKEVGKEAGGREA